MIKCNDCQCNDCVLAQQQSNGYCRCWNCYDCGDGSGKLDYCSMKNAYEEAVRRNDNEY